MPSAGANASSLQAVSDQELKRAVEADLRQGGRAGVVRLQCRWQKLWKAEIRVLCRDAGETTERVRIVEEFLRAIGQIAGKHGGLCFAVKNLVADDFAGSGNAKDRGQLRVALLDCRFPRGAHLSKRNDVHI